MKKYILLSLLIVSTSCRSSDKEKPVESLTREQPTLLPDPAITPVVKPFHESEVEFEINQSHRELPKGQVAEFARINFAQKDLAPTLIVKTLAGDCNFTAYDDRKGVFVLSVTSRSVQKCQGEYQFEVESRNWSKKIAFEIEFFDANPDIKVEFSFKDPLTGNEIKAFNSSETLYLLKNDVELVGQLKYGANTNIQILKDSDPTLKTKCGEWAKIGVESSIAKRYFGLNSGVTLVRFNGRQEVSKDLADLAKEEATKKGLRIKHVMLAPAIAYKKFSFLPKSITQTGLSAGARGNAESFSKPLNDFLNNPGRVVDELALASVCDLINSNGIRSVNSDGTAGPIIRLVVEEAQ